MRVLLLSSFFTIFVLLFYRQFISLLPFVANDFPLLFPESRNFSPFWAIAWDYMGGGGIGASALKTMWIDLYANFVYWFSNNLNIPWALSQRIFWILPFLVISLISSYKFSGLFLKENIFRALASVIYTFNTYILLVVGGGQFGIAFAYGLVPLTLYCLFKLFNVTNFQNLIISGIVSGLVIAADSRVALLTFGIGALWYLFFIRDFSLKKLVLILSNFILAGLINSYWLFPMVYSLITNSVPASVSDYGSLQGVKFLSFATLENAMSLLHPNWPENIFGKVYFMKPEFLILPILAFSSLLFKPRKEILFFAALCLIAIFLGKGANDPFGNIYLFLVDKFPGFAAFRDSTKFYILIALGFSVLIPYTLQSISIKFPKYKAIVYSIFVIFLLFALRVGWTGELSGIFKPKEIPEEYIRLNTNLSYSYESTSDFSRTLWVPRRQKYGYFDPRIPAVDSEVLFKGKDISKITERELYLNGIYYIIVPTDPDGEIFLKDRKYSDKLRRQTINKVEKIDFLQRIGTQPGIGVYIASSTTEHFFMEGESGYLNYTQINPTEYRTTVHEAQAGDRLIFSEGFDRNWVAESSEFRIKSSEFKKLNSFILPKSGEYSLEIYYKPQKWVNIGLIISFVTLISLIFLLPNLAKKAKK